MRMWIGKENEGGQAPLQVAGRRTKKKTSIPPKKGLIPVVVWVVLGGLSIKSVGGSRGVQGLLWECKNWPGKAKETSMGKRKPWGISTEKVGKCERKGKRRVMGDQGK